MHIHTDSDLEDDGGNTVSAYGSTSSNHDGGADHSGLDLLLAAVDEAEAKSANAVSGQRQRKKKRSKKRKRSERDEEQEESDEGSKKKKKKSKKRKKKSKKKKKDKEEQDDKKKSYSWSDDLLHELVEQGNELQLFTSGLQAPNIDAVIKNLSCAEKPTRRQLRNKVQSLNREAHRVQEEMQKKEKNFLPDGKPRGFSLSLLFVSTQIL